MRAARWARMVLCRARREAIPHRDFKQFSVRRIQIGGRTEALMTRNGSWEGRGPKSKRELADARTHQSTSGLVSGLVAKKRCAIAVKRTAASYQGQNKAAALELE